MICSIICTLEIILYNTAHSRQRHEPIKHNNRYTIINQNLIMVIIRCFRGYGCNYTNNFALSHGFNNLFFS